MRASASLRLSALVLLAVTASSGCGDAHPGSDTAASTTGSTPSSEIGTGDPAPNKAGVANELEGLGTVLEISLPDVTSYSVVDRTLTIHFDSGSKADVTAHCLISRSAAGGLGLPEDYRLVMAYPDGEQECAH